ncbi:MAG: MoaD/ThiS family protein [Arenicellales bacterium WSBS_2016_MAG_OTU3]
MKINLKLYASLAQHLPAGAYRNAVKIEIPHKASLNWIIDHYNVPRELAHLVLVNGVYACDTDRDTFILNEDDTLAIWPPVAGG